MLCLLILPDTKGCVPHLSATELADGIAKVNDIRIVMCDKCSCLLYVCEFVCVCMCAYARACVCESVYLCVLFLHALSIQ